jgi:hypothetical protein
MISMVDPTPRFTTSEQSRDGAGPSYGPTDAHYAPTLAAARGMGWFSLGLGAAQVLTPGLVGALTGVRNKKLMQMYGLRELVCGLGILNSEQPANWMWARLAGDAMDFATLLEVLASGDESRVDEAAMSMIAVIGAAVTDAACATALSAASAVES